MWHRCPVTNNITSQYKSRDHTCQNKVMYQHFLQTLLHSSAMSQTTSQEHFYLYPATHRFNIDFVGMPKCINKNIFNKTDADSRFLKKNQLSLAAVSKW